MTRIADDAMWTSVPAKRERSIWIAATLALMSILVLAKLDLHPLWDDEANTALFGRTMWATGDLSALDGDNLLAYRNGAELDDELLNRHIPPLHYFVAAPFVGDTHSAWWARFPFALAGIGAIALLYVWLARSGATRRTLTLASLAILGNVSFILYTRQARYYALSFLAAAAVMYAYANRERGWRMAVLLTASLAGMLASNYLCYAGVAAALGVDYLVAGRKTSAFPWRQTAFLAATQLVAIAVIVGTWYPMKQVDTGPPDSWILDRLQLWAMTLRDMNACEFGVGLLILAAPILARRARDLILTRLTLALFVATATVSVFSPQPTTMFIADVRYVAFLIPLCLLICIRTLESLPVRPLIVVLLGIVSFQTTVLHKAVAVVSTPPLYIMRVRVSLLDYLDELRDPPPSAYRIASDWLRANAPAGESAVVWPEYATYPLIFHAPHLVYGWQLDTGKGAQFPQLAKIHTYGASAPDWVVTFVTAKLDKSYLGKPLHRLGARYEQVAEFAITALDMSRPELYWHRFRGVWYLPHAPLTIWRRIKP